jgi:hypothetical protein
MNGSYIYGRGPAWRFIANPEKGDFFEKNLSEIRR